MEARAASMIRHSSIVDVTDFGELPDGCSFIVMEFLDGPNLSQVIDQQSQLPLYRAVTILTQVCQALQACHAAGIAHRDLKPENIVLLRREGRRDLVTVPRTPNTGPTVQRERFYDEVKILDFGIAKIQQMTAALDHATKAKGMVFGSPYYLSPEQARGEPGDHHSDIYSIGIIFYEMLTGEIPFDGETPQEILGKHVQTPMPSMCTTRPELKIPIEADQLVARATAKNPRDRPRSAEAFLDGLQHCFGDVIYGRDIDRFLQVRRQSTVLRWQSPKNKKSGSTTDKFERRLTPRGVQINSELEGLFNESFEPPLPVTSSTLNEIRAVEKRRDPSGDKNAVRAELHDLFHGKDD
jgi:serine/threonine protein kinase